jgi:hypothetical protein
MWKALGKIGTELGKHIGQKFTWWPVLSERSCPVRKRDMGEWAKAYLDFFDLGPPLRLAKTAKKFSNGSTPRLFGLTINQCHIHLTMPCNKVLWILCPLKLDMSDDDGDST